MYSLTTKASQSLPRTTPLTTILHEWYTYTTLFHQVSFLKQIADKYITLVLNIRTAIN